MNKLYAALAVGLSVLSIAGVASAQTDPLTGTGGAIDTVSDQVVGYAGPIGVALVAVGVAFIAVKLIPRVIRMVGNRLG